MKRASVICCLMGLALILMPRLIAAQETVSAEPDALSLASQKLVEERLKLWVERKRDYQISPIFEQLARVAPQHPLILEARIQAALVDAQFDLAQQLAEQLRQKYPNHLATLRTKELLLLQGEQQQQLAEARLLNLAGRPAEALVLFRQVFPNPPLTLDLALEYWGIVGATGEREQALTGLLKLQQRYPEAPEVKLAIIQQRLAADQLTANDLATLTALTLDPIFGGQAFSLWQRILPYLDASPLHRQALNRLAIYFPDHAEINRYQSELASAAATWRAPAVIVEAEVDTEGETESQSLVTDTVVATVPADVAPEEAEPVTERQADLERDAPTIAAVIVENEDIVGVDDREAIFWLGYEQASRDSTDGISSLATQTLIARLTVPMADDPNGEWFIQVDPTVANAGAADLDDGFWRPRFGTGLICEQNCPTGIQPVAKDTGVAVGIGAQWEYWHADIGFSPLGFDRHEWVGSLGYDGDLGEFGWGAEVERRILTSALVNFAGIDDPFSERSWGPVVRNNAGLSFNWDQGTGWGWWSNLGMNWYRGHNLADNQQWYAYTGVYTTIYDTEAFAIDTGLTALSWGFANDQSQNTFGQGGYYSPKQYLSASIPLTFYGRLDRWSYRLRASFGKSWTKLAAAPFYPNNPELQALAEQRVNETGIEPVFAGGTGGGFGKSFEASLEYRMTRHWYIGFSAKLERSEFYTPDNFMFYFRYHFAGTSLPPRRPPEPPQRYVDNPWY